MKKLNFKKKIKLKNQRASNVVKLLKKYSTKEWIHSIRSLNLFHGIGEDINDNIKTKPEFLVVAADFAIRISKPNGLGNNPTIDQISYLLNSEIDLTDGPNNFIKLFGLGGVSLLATWQNRFHYNQSNMIGRMHLLYNNYNNHLIDTLNISIEDIYLIFLALLAVYEDKNKIFFKKNAIMSKDVPSLSEEKIDRFLSYFAITQNEYVKKAKNEKIYEKTFGKFKYLIRYPIIEIENDLFVIPVFEQLIDTISNNLYFLLLESFSKISKTESGKFLTEFGTVLENYVLELAKQQFGAKKIVDANKIVKDKSKDRCEAVIFYNERALAIEVKKMNFKRDALVDMDKEHIDDLLKKHIVKAFKQIETTLEYIRYKNYYGLIVIPDIMIGLSMIRSYVETTFKESANFDKNIFICTLSSYEALMSNSEDNIFLILDNVKNRDFNEGDDINIVMIDMINNHHNISFINSFLQRASEKSLLKLQHLRG